MAFLVRDDRRIREVRKGWNFRSMYVEEIEVALFLIAVSALRGNLRRCFFPRGPQSRIIVDLTIVCPLDCIQTVSDVGISFHARALRMQLEISLHPARADTNRASVSVFFFVTLLSLSLFSSLLSHPHLDECNLGSHIHIRQKPISLMMKPLNSNYATFNYAFLSHAACNLLINFCCAHVKHD